MRTRFWRKITCIAVAAAVMFSAAAPVQAAYKYLGTGKYNNGNPYYHTVLVYDSNKSSAADPPIAKVSTNVKGGRVNGMNMATWARLDVLGYECGYDNKPTLVAKGVLGTRMTDQDMGQFSKVLSQAVNRSITEWVREPNGKYVRTRAYLKFQYRAKANGDWVTKKIPINIASAQSEASDGRNALHYFNVAVGRNMNSSSNVSSYTSWRDWPRFLRSQGGSYTVTLAGEDFLKGCQLGKTSFVNGRGYKASAPSGCSTVRVWLELKVLEGERVVKGTDFYGKPIYDYVNCKDIGTGGSLAASKKTSITLSQMKAGDDFSVSNPTNVFTFADGMYVDR